MCVANYKPSVLSTLTDPTITYLTCSNENQAPPERDQMGAVIRAALVIFTDY